MKRLIFLIAVLYASGLHAQQQPEHARTREYNTALGVECTHCHAAIDFADAAKPTFDFARRMERMRAGLNDGPLKAYGPISCWTCHRGNARPARLARERWEPIAAAHDADFAGTAAGRRLAMAVYAASLGVECSYCHEADWKNGSKPAYRMVEAMLPIFDLIPTYFDKDVRMPQTQCFMCHQGRVKPERSKP